MADFTLFEPASGEPESVDQLETAVEELKIIDKKEDSPKKDPKTPSLQALAQGQALDQILKSNFNEDDFVTLEPSLQKLLFAKFRSEVTRLRAVEDRWRRVRGRCPTTDIDIQLKYGRIQGDAAYNTRDRLRDEWEYSETENIDPDQYPANTNTEDGEGKDEAKEPVTFWGQFDLYYDEEGGPLKVRDRFDLSSLTSKNFDFTFYHRISSQLLYYRLAATFGMPPTLIDDEYKVCWSANMRFRNCPGMLSLYDFKGSASCSFRGTKEASEAALDLLNYLVSVDCIHTYDYTIAGTLA